MEIKEFEFDKINNFIKNIIKLTYNNYIKWDFKHPQYDDTKLSQQSLCVRLTAKFYNKHLILISQDNKFNFEVIFKDVSDIAEELPFVNDDKIQEQLKELYKFIIYRPEIHNKFNELFDKVHYEAAEIK